MLSSLSKTFPEGKGTVTVATGVVVMENIYTYVCSHPDRKSIPPTTHINDYKKPETDLKSFLGYSTYVLDGC